MLDLPVLFKYLLVYQTDSWNSFLMDITMKYTSVQYIKHKMLRYGWFTEIHFRFNKVWATLH